MHLHGQSRFHTSCRSRASFPSIQFTVWRKCTSEFRSTEALVPIFSAPHSISISTTVYPWYMVNARIGLETGSREVQLWSVGATERHKGAKSRWKQLYRQFKPQSLSSLREREKERVERERIEIGERSFYPCKPNCGYYSVGGSFCSSIVNLPFRGTLRVLVPHLVQRCRGYRG